MMQQIFDWLLMREPATLGYVQPWNPVIAERQAAITEQMLLGSCGRSRVELSAAQRARRQMMEAN